MITALRIALCVMTCAVTLALIAFTALMIEPLVMWLQR